MATAATHDARARRRAAADGNREKRKTNKYK
jgi:hypothetical protein